MSKVSELVSMVIDLVKIMSDDSTINENHIRYLLGLYRAFLLKQRYEKILLESYNELMSK